MRAEFGCRFCSATFYDPEMRNVHEQKYCGAAKRVDL